MEEGEQKVCLAEPTLELMEEKPLQVQVQLMEEMQDMEALAAEEVLEAKVEVVIIISLKILKHQEQMEAAEEREVMGAVAVEEEEEVALLLPLQELEVREVLAVLEEGAEAAEILGLL